MDFHCLLVHVNFTRLNKIEATYGSSRVNDKLDLAQLLRLGDKEAAWPSGQRVARRSWVRVALWALVGLVLGRPELKSSATA